MTGRRVLLVLPVLPVPLVPMAMTARRVPLVLPVPLVPLVPMAMTARRVLLVLPVPLVPTATTARRVLAGPAGVVGSVHTPTRARSPALAAMPSRRQSHRDRDVLHGHDRVGRRRDQSQRA